MNESRVPSPESRVDPTELETRDPRLGTIASICRTALEDELGLYSVDGITPKVVAYPQSAEEVSEIVALAAEHKWAVIPRGGGSQMELGNIPRAADVVVCTTDMNQVLEYEPADLVVSAQAGLRLAELQRILGVHGQCLALDPPLPEQATIGGIIAANPSGPLRLRHGTCRDMLLGVKVVNADGNITKAGGKVVKNVTGYDMCKLYTGSLGTLGVIVEASFKLAPLPRVERTLLAAFADLDAAYTAARAMYKAALPVRACELLAGPLAQPGQALLAVWIGGGDAAVERQVRDVTQLCAESSSIEQLEGDELHAFWRKVEDFGHEESFETVAKISVLPTRTGDLLRQLPPQMTFVSHVLSGVTYVFGQEASSLESIVQELSGYSVLERCPLSVKQMRSIWGAPGEDFKLMERIKREFDPDGILNPGRYVGRL